MIIGRIHTPPNSPTLPYSRGAEPVRATGTGSVEQVDEAEFRSRDPCEHELRDPIARIDPDGGIAIRRGRVPVPGRDQAGAFIIRVDHTDGVAQHKTLV